MPLESGKNRLERLAYNLNKAMLLLACLDGIKLTPEQAWIPAYEHKTRAQLIDIVNLLTRKVAMLLDDLFERSGRTDETRAVRWLSDRSDAWEQQGPGPFVVGSVVEVESNVGRLKAHRTMDIPPYAEVLAQPGIPAAFRHPEYMLTRDLGMLFDFFLESEALCISMDLTSQPTWASAATENNIGLGRSVVQACFNLLESFVSGIARAHVMTSSGLDETTTSRLLNTREPLSRRVRSIPAIVVGRPSPLDANEFPLADLFGPIKRSRDTFVHCEPGDFHSERGYVKEDVFNDISPALVVRAVTCTHAAVLGIWNFVYGTHGPSWLPPLDEKGRFGRENLTVVPRAAARAT